MNKRIMSISILILFALSIAPAYPVQGNSQNSVPLPVISWTDDFNSLTLNSQWQWIRQNPAHWSLAANPGFFQITTEQSFSTINNLLVQHAPPGSYTIETRLIFTPTQNYQIAGLLIYLDDNHFLQLGRAFCAASPTCVNDGIYFDSILNGAFDGSNFATVLSPLTTSVYLRIVRQNNLYSAYMSQDGTSWNKIGDHAIPYAPTFIGLKANNGAQGDAEIPANFDYFTLLDYSPHLYLPLVKK